jgi:hypothetical protein
VHYRVKLLATTLAASLGAAGMLATTAGSASADTTKQLSITSFYQVVADTAHNQLFMSSPSDNEILVTDLSGNPVKTITGEGGVKGIALSPDGSTLYAALSTGNAVSAVSTTTLTETTRVALGSTDTPRDVAVQSGKVWVSYDDSSATPSGAIGDIDFSAVTPALETQANMGSWNSAPELAADPQDTANVLVATDPFVTAPPVASYDTSVDPATVRASSNSFTNCETEEDLAVVPGGSQFILACGWPYAHYIYGTADLSQQGSYASTTYPDAVAIAANGDVAAGTANGLPTVPDIYVYQQGGSTPLNDFSPNSSGNNLAPRGLTWSADESQLYAVLQSPGNVYELQVIDNPTVSRTVLSLTAPSSIYITHSVTLTGNLTLSVGGTLPAGTPITITRSVTGGTDKIFNVSTAADGSFSLTDKPPTTGQYTYAASYAGSTTTTSSTASAKVTVKRLPTSLKVSTDHSTYSYDATVHVTAHLGTTYTSRTVSIYARSLGSTTKKLLVSGKVNSKGNLTAKYVAPHSTEFYAVFTGDAHYAPATATRTVGVRARVTMKIGGYYGSKVSGGRTYRLYHRSSHLDVAITVAPNKRGQCVVIEIQEYFQGHWYTQNFPCVALNRYSKVSGYLVLTATDLNRPYRIRANYRRGTDISNLNSHSVWHYFMVES